MMLTLNEIRVMLGLAPHPTDDDAVRRMGHPSSVESATGYSIDSRTTVPGDLFFAIHGERFDGHDFVGEALKAGAVAAVIEESHRAKLAEYTDRLILVPDALAALQQLAREVRRKWSGTVLAVTGSVGKTTTKEMIATVLSAKYQVLKSHGNLNNQYGLPLQLLKLGPHHVMAVLEMGMSAPGEIAALAAIAEPNCGVITAVAPVHTEFFSDGIAGVARAKRELVEALPADGIAFLNADDPRVLAMHEHTQARVVMFGCAEIAKVRAVNIKDRGVEGIAFQVQARGEQAEFQLRLVGAHNVTNALAAVAVGLEFQMSLPEISAALAAMLPPEGRGQTLHIDGAIVINDCYNSNPLALDSMVNALVGVQAQRRIVVAGEMMELGPDAAAMHAACGRHMAQAGVHHVIGVRGNARSIVEAAAAAGVPAAFVETPEEAGDWLAANLRPGDAVLLKASRGVKLERALQRLLQLRQSPAAK